MAYNHKVGSVIVKLISYPLQIILKVFRDRQLENGHLFQHLKVMENSSNGVVLKGADIDILYPAANKPLNNRIQSKSSSWLKNHLHGGTMEQIGNLAPRLIHELFSRARHRIIPSANTASGVTVKLIHLVIDTPWLWESCSSIIEVGQSLYLLAKLFQYLD